MSRVAMILERRGDVWYVGNESGLDATASWWPRRPLEWQAGELALPEGHVALLLRTYGTRGEAAHWVLLHAGGNDIKPVNRDRRPRYAFGNNEIPTDAVELRRTLAFSDSVRQTVGVRGWQFLSWPPTFAAPMWETRESSERYLERQSWDTDWKRFLEIARHCGYPAAPAVAVDVGAVVWVAERGGLVFGDDAWVHPAIRPFLGGRAATVDDRGQVVRPTRTAQA